MNKKRLLKLADLLEADANNKKGIKFDLNLVAGHSEPQYDGRDRGYGDRFFIGNEKPTLDCKTAACAVGLAAISGVFKRQGLDYYVSKNGIGLHPKFGRYRGFGSADRRFFDLTRKEHTFLFQPTAYDGEQIGARGERTVAKRIRDFVAGKDAP